jgi:hypothetical protein
MNAFRLEGWYCAATRKNIVLYAVDLKFGRLIAGFRRGGPSFNPSPVHVGFLMEKLALEEDSL